MKQLAIKAAKEAGKILIKNFGKIKKIEKKDKNTLVTNVDIEVEEKVIGLIEQKYPKHSILSEEVGEINKKSDYKWLIDPLDGTHNYVHGLSLCGVSIALEQKKEVKLGVIYMPFFDQLFVAEKGKGAFINGKRIKASNINKLNNSLLLFCSSLYKNKKSKFWYLNRVIHKISRIRMSGAAVFDLTSIAQGNAEILMDFDTHPWDVAAGFLLIKEAGGRITDFNGKEVNHYCKEFIASNGKIHKKILKCLK